MDMLNLSIDLLCLIYLLHTLGKLSVTRRPAFKPLRFGRWRVGRRSRLQAVPGFITGLALAWIAADRLGTASPAAAVLIAAALLPGHWIKREIDDASGLALLEHLKTNIQAGQDFFTALGTGAQDLPDSPLKRALDKSIERFSSRLTFEKCLEPIAKTGGMMAQLAADVRRAGGENSPALALLVGQVHQRAILHWNLRSRRRVIEDRFAAIIPVCRSAAVGGAIFRLAQPPSIRFLGFGLLILIVGRAARHFQRFDHRRPFALLGGGLAAVLVLFPFVAAYSENTPEIRVRTYDPAPLYTEKALRLPGELGLIDTKIPDDLLYPPDRRDNTSSARCRIDTGVPGGRVNLRDAPGMDGRVVFYAVEGEVLEISGGVNGWLRVRKGDGVSGWVFGSLCAAGQTSDFFGGQ